MFGLIIEPKRLVNFEKVDQPAAHEIFLRDALTTGNLGTVPPFLKHNLLKLEEVERVEDKYVAAIWWSMKKQFISSMRRKFLKKLRVVVVLKTGVQL